MASYKFFREDILLFVLMPLNNQSTSNEFNSAQWNGLHPVFVSNFTNKSFFYIWVFLKKLFGKDVLPPALGNPCKFDPVLYSSLRAYRPQTTGFAMPFEPIPEPSAKISF